MTYSPSEVDHRDYVAHNAPFSSGEAVFRMLVDWGLEETHSLCDVGCGSLRVGRFIMIYLNAGGYAAIEPNILILKAGIEKEVSQELWDLKGVKSNNHVDYAWAVPSAFDWVLISGVLVHKSHREIDMALHAAADMVRDGGYVVADYYPSAPHWTDDENPVYAQIAPHYRECLTSVDTRLDWTGQERELFGAHYIQFVKRA